VPIATPANWIPGQDVIVALSLNNEAAEARFGPLDIKLPYLRFAKAPK
jgi:thioredoxin-dependent peroxiredoxin